MSQESVEPHGERICPVYPSRMPLRPPFFTLDRSPPGWVEVDRAPRSRRNFQIVGFRRGGLEAREVRAATVNCGFDFPQAITASLAPQT